MITHEGWRFYWYLLKLLIVLNWRGRTKKSFIYYFCCCILANNKLILIGPKSALDYVKYPLAAYSYQMILNNCRWDMSFNYYIACGMQWSHPCRAWSYLNKIILSWRNKLFCCCLWIPKYITLNFQSLFKCCSRKTGN